MKRIPALTTLLFASEPALAHDGVHLHPHDAETWLAIAAAGVVAAAVLLLKAR